MPPWNEVHYARAAEFLRLIAAAAPALSPATAPTARPAEVAPPAAAPAPSPAASTAPHRPGASAGSAFKKIPWKK